LAEQQPGGSVSLTPVRALVVAAMFGGLAGWLLGVTTNAFDMIAPEVPWSAPIGVILVTALVGALAYSTYQRIQVRRERMEPSRAVAFLVLGKASALAGAVLVGGYLAYALLFVNRLEAAAPRDRVIRSAITVLAGAALCGVGLLLERACRVPRDDDDDQAGTDTPD
jgi:H+/Cl- antiporter ClcA